MAGVHRQATARRVTCAGALSGRICVVCVCVCNCVVYVSPTGTAPRCFTVPRGLQPTGQFPGRPPLVKAVSAPISKQYMWAPGASRGKTLISKPREGKFSPSKLPMKTADASRQGPTQKAKCVWKQQIMW